MKLARGVDQGARTDIARRERVLAAAAAATLFGVVLSTPTATAVPTYWDANGATAGQTDGAGAWLTANQWFDGSANTSWVDGRDAVFGVSGAGGAVTLSGPVSVDALVFRPFTGTYTLGTTGQTITLGGGITNQAPGGTATIISAITLTAAQTWAAQQPSGNVTSLGGVNLDGNTLTIDGAGTTSFTGATTGLISGAGGLVKNGSGVLIMGGAGTAQAHTYTGGTTINGGVVRFQAADTPGTSGSFGAGGITINGGVIEGYFSGSFSRSLGTGNNQVRITGGTSGFSGQGATGTAFTIGTSGSALVWGGTHFNPDVFVLQSAAVNADGKMTLNNGIDLNGATRTIGSFGGTTAGGATVTGAVVNNGGGAAGLTKVGTGNLILTNTANSYTGPTTLNDGTLTLSGNGRITASTSLALNSGALRLVNTTQLERFPDGAAINASGGAIQLENTSGANVYTETLGSLSLSSGQLNIVLATNQAGAGSQTLSFAALTRTGDTNTSAVTFSAATTGPQAGGQKNMVRVVGGGTTAAGQIIGPWATTGTAINAQTDYAVYSGDFVVPAGIAASGQATWTDATRAYTVNSTAAIGATTLTGTRNVAALRSTSTATTLTSVDIVTNVITVTGHSFADGDPVVFGATPPTGLTSGVVYFVRNPGTDTFEVAATPGGAAIDITAAGAGNIVGGIRLATGANLGTTGILHTTAAPLAIVPGSGGVVTLPSAASDSLHLTTSLSPIILAAPIADNGVGTLTLVKNGSSSVVLTNANTYTGNTVVNAGTLQLGINGTNNGAVLGNGNYGGDIAIARGATLHVQTNANQTLSGVISGDGALIKSSTGTLTLSGDNTYTGKTSITPLTTGGAGRLVVSSFNSVVTDPVLGTVKSASSSLGAPTTVANGTIDFGATGIQGGGILEYVGPGETTDRVINIVTNGNGATKVINASGTGLLKFTSQIIVTGGSLTNDLQLGGTGRGELVGGLPVGMRNFTKADAGTWKVGGPGLGFSGTVTVNGGTLQFGRPDGLFQGYTPGWTAARIIANTGTTLAFNVGGAGEFTATDVTLLLGNLGALGGAINNNGLRSGSRVGFDTSNAVGVFTVGDIIANSTGTGGGAIGLTKIGTGTLSLNQANTYTGGTTVAGGTLLAMNTSGSATGTGAVLVAAGGTLGGTGSIAGALTVATGGRLSPGTSPGVLTTAAAVTLAAGSTLQIELGGATPGLYDQIIAGGQLTISDAMLSVANHGVYTTTDPSQVYYIAAQPGTTPVAGTFRDTFGDVIAQGQTFVFPDGITQARITYQANWTGTQIGSSLTGGNDVALYDFTVVPEPATLGVAGACGLGLLSRRRRRVCA